jgi:hypothetical protein
MRNSMNVALVSLGVLLGTAGCTNFLTGDKLSENPNQPSTASIQQLFVGVQAGQFAFQEGTVPMMMCMWVQACTAVNGRFVEQAGRYNFGENSNLAANNGDWGSIYDAGGLVDIKGVEAAARSGGDSTWLGIAKIWEAFTIGSAADMWGDIPYTEVQSSPTPVLDHQFVVYDSVQSLLTQAIAELGTATGTGPGVADLVFNGDRPSWVAAAWTLKARYFLHTAESLGTPAYQNAIAAALNGIADASGSSDFRSFHTVATSERNMWAQFQGSSFGNDLVAGKALVDVMKGRSDPRLPQYFCLAANGAYGGQDFNTPVPDTVVSSFTCKPERFSDLFEMPYASYAENELILAEAYHATADDPSALTHLNNERATVPLPALVGITGAALLDSIMTEKYVAMFQNIETINDYRRTCIPAITPVTPNVPFGFTTVPGRLFYAQIERNVNPNIPDGSTQLATHGFRNEGDVNPCP